MSPTFQRVRSRNRDQRVSLVIQTVTAVIVLLTIFGSTALMTGLGPTMPALIAAAFVLTLLVRQSGTWTVHLTLVVLFMTTVPEIPRGVRLGGIFVYFNELSIVGALIYSVGLYRNSADIQRCLKKSIVVRVAALFAFAVLIGIGRALLRGYPFWDIQYDLRSIIELFLVIFITAVVTVADDWRRYLPTITAILTLSAALMVYASVTGFVLWGRTETAELYAAGGRVIAGGSDAVRFLTQTTPLALAAMLGCVALIFLGRVSAISVMPMLVPAFLISILSFSRNSLLALAGTLAMVLIISLVDGRIVQLLLRLATLPLVIVVISFGVVGVGGALGASDWIGRQATGYANRVLAGFDESNERADTSAGYRDEEIEYLKRAGAEHPIFGGGFGTHYKPPSGERDGFPAFEGTMYAHNAYYWLYVKVGIFGLTSFVALVISCLWSAISRSVYSTLLSTGACVLAGLALAIWVTPMPIEQPGSALLGMAMGVCASAAAVGAVGAVGSREHADETSQS